MFAAIILLFIILFFYWNFIYKRQGLPPGPIPLPFFGNTLTLSRSKCAYLPYKLWADKYGPIYTFWMGECPIVTVTDYSLMNELFVKNGDAFVGRDFLNHLSKLVEVHTGNHGVIQTQGDTWRVMRRFGLLSMRTLGVGKAGMEKQFKEDINEMINKLSNQVLLNNGENINLQLYIDRLIGSTINRVLFGFAFNDNQMDEFNEIKSTFDKASRWQFSFCGRLLVAAPILRHLPFFYQSFVEFSELPLPIYKYLNKQIGNRIEIRNLKNEKKEPRDLLDCYLDQMESDEADEEFNMDNFRALCYDLLLAGQETTGNTLSFLVLYLLLDQRVQSKLQAELDNLVEGNEELIGLSQRPQANYTNAVINEVQRLCNLLPLNLSHKTMFDVGIMDGKYFLKEGTVILPQISCLLYDEKVFPNPHLFIPERFLDDKGQLKRFDSFIPFGLGKRACMGESLARAELFLFTASFFRTFQVLPVDPLNPPAAQKQKAFVVRPDPYKCRLILRK
ncbi:unnamed protein product [Meloidogyne enterolobii]|uniref:Uncharacterized protein n=1 Tax=Meloidogyne enterolobii TaxID=390850 RepID=A0ACB0YID7_MELEN